MRLQTSITRRGAVLMGGTVALWCIGMLAGDGTMVVLGLCGAVILAVAWLLGKFILRGLDASIYLPGHLAAGVPFDLEFTLVNRRPFLDAFNTVIKLPLPGRITYTAIAPWTAAGSASRITQRTSIPRRGHQRVHRVTLSTTFPLGLFHNTRQLEINKELIATPRPIIPLEMSNHGCLQDTVPRNGVSAGQASGEPSGIRPWQPGDTARRIHWPASARSMARGHGLRIRDYDPPGFHPEQCHIIFHSYATGREILTEERFERALSLLSGSLLELQKRGIPCQLTCDMFDWQPIQCSTRRQVIQCLESLARAQRCSSTESHDLETALRAVSPEHTLMIISDMTPDSWQHLLVQHPQTMVIDIRQIRYRHRILRTAG